MARVFLAGLIGQDPARGLQAGELQAEAEARKRAVLNRQAEPSGQ